MTFLPRVTCDGVEFVTLFGGEAGRLLRRTTVGRAPAGWHQPEPYGLGTRER
jgi:hypothetical protein